MTSKPNELEHATIGVGGQGFRALGAGENFAWSPIQVNERKAGPR